MSPTRRGFVAGAAGVAAGAVAGCLGGDASAGGGYTAFYTLEDWADAVGGDHMPFESPVPVGRIGHGWEPDLQTTAAIAESSVFVYLDLPDFAWAQEAASTLRRDYDDVHVVDALRGIELHRHDHDHADDDHDAGDDADVDPHVWVDPVRARRMVDTVADGLAGADPANAEGYRSNADDYIARLDDLHASFEGGLADRERSIAVLAGHDSFGYLADRYGLEVVTPVGVAPDASPAPGDIADVLEVIEEHDVEVVLTDAFESDRLAETILENSSVDRIREVTPAEGTTADWLDRGWGYVEQMEEINLPSFKDALGAP